MKPFNYAVTDTTIILYWEKHRCRVAGRAFAIRCT